MEQRRRPLVPPLVALAQLGLAGFLVFRYLDIREHLGIVSVFVVMLAGSALLLLADRWWATTTALMISTVLTGFLWLGAFDNRTSDAYLGAAVTSVPWMALVINWLRGRSRRKRESVARASEEPATRDDVADDADGWTREWAGGRVKFVFMLLFGALSLIGGVAMLADGSIADGVGLLSFGVALMSVAPVFRAWSRKGQVTAQPIAERGGEMGLVIPYSRSKTFAAVVAAAAMAVFCATFAFGAFREGSETETKFVLFGIAGSVLFAGMGLIQLARNGFRGGYIALLEGGIYATIGSAKSFIPWDAVSHVKDVEMKMWVRGATVQEPFIGIMLSHPERVEMSWLARRLMRANRWLAADISYPVRSLDVDPRAALRAIRHYLDNPASRAELRDGRVTRLPSPERGAVQGKEADVSE